MPHHSMLFFAFLIPLLLTCVNKVRAALDLGFHDDSDLSHFVTRPEIKAPLFNVTIHNLSGVSPGYWFVAPYANILQDSQARNYYQACQTGPHIYDGQGNLLWSGACLVKNQNTCDFRLSRYNDSDHLSAILYTYGNDTKGHGFIMNSSFSMTETIYAPKTIAIFNMHELNIIEEGRTALHIIQKADFVDVSELGLGQDAGWVANIGFREVDMVTGKTKFEWWAVDHVLLEASSVAVNIQRPYPNAWNFFHMNSVDKNTDGDYLISSRYTDCIYKISGKDGSVLWRLGGKHSSFLLDGFNFSKQHDARFIEQNDSTTIITFLDNAADDLNTTSSYSSALLVALETSVTPMVARVVRRWIRPDGRLSRLRGNFQLLPNGNAFIGWSDNSYISEHTTDGELLMEARFLSNRFVTYRAYKFNFTGAPIEPPNLKTFVFGTTPATSTVVYYVSWNGATEVDSWRFCRDGNGTTQPKIIGSTSKTGFETMYQTKGLERQVYAEAIAADGRVLGTSPVQNITIPLNWQFDYDIDNQFDGDSNSSDIWEQRSQKIGPEVRKQEL